MLDGELSVASPSNGNLFHTINLTIQLLSTTAGGTVYYSTYYTSGSVGAVIFFAVMCGLCCYRRRRYQMIRMRNNLANNTTNTVVTTVNNVNATPKAPLVATPQPVVYVPPSVPGAVAYPAQPQPVSRQVCLVRQCSVHRVLALYLPHSQHQQAMAVAMPQPVAVVQQPFMAVAQPQAVAVAVTTTTNQF